MAAFFLVLFLLLLAFLAAVILFLGLAGLMGGKIGVRISGFAVILFAFVSAFRISYACGWPLVGMVIPIPVADDWKMRMLGCDSPAAFAASLIVGPMLLLAIFATAILTWWLERVLRKRNGESPV